VSAPAKARVRIKICGLKKTEDIDAALDAGADMIGLVFFPPSPRHLKVDVGAALAAYARGKNAGVEIVALTVDAADALISDIITHVRPNFLQLHGRETPARAAATRARWKTPVIKAFGVSTQEDVAIVREYEAACDEFLFDARPPKGATRPGGNGEAFDWTILRALNTLRPWLLSGGLNAGNVGAAIVATGAQAVDVSSGVESAPGVKDARLIAEFVRAVRA
jgi:phosphoribosylanthranilate isomerase